MQGGQHQVPRQRGLHRNLGGLPIADLAHHDHVRVLSQDGTQTTGEGHVDLAVDLSLADAGKVVLDRVFDGEDIARYLVEVRKRGVQRRGLAGTGGPGDQENAMWFLQHAHEASTHRTGHLQVVDVQTHCLLVQQTQHHPLAVGGGQGRHPHVHFMASQA
ncbi:hypothetical protein D9M71_726380 [compost metagenome]